MPTSSYPNSFDEFVNPNNSDKANNPSTNHSDLHKHVNSAIVAIEATLGANPQGGYETVAERLSNLDGTASSPTGGVVYSINGETGVVTVDAASIGAEPAGTAAAAVAALVDSSPGTLNTLNELAAALGDDPNFATTITNSLANKQPLDADLTALAGAGNSATLAAVTAAFTTALQTKLNGIATGATANSTDAQLRDRTTHTGAQAISTVTGLQAALDSKMDIAQVVNNQTGTTYTVVTADRGKLVTLTNGAAITVTVPTASFLGLSPGDSIDFAVLGAGMATFVADAGATVNGTPSLITRSQYSAVTLVALTTTAWLLVGDLT